MHLNPKSDTEFWFFEEPKTNTPEKLGKTQ